MRIKVSDISLNYQLAGKGKTLTLIHGLGNDSRSWEPLIPALSQYYQVLTWDVRGHGQSDKPPGNYSVKLLASDLAALLRALNLGDAYVLGHSMGGVIALRFALDFPELCSALIVSSSSAEVSPQATRYWQDVAASVLQKGIQAVPFDPAPFFSRGFIERNPKAADAMKAKRLTNDSGAFARAVLAISSYNYNEELGNIRCPTLIMVGDQDSVSPPGGSVRMNRLIPGSKLIIFKDCGHMSYVEQPEVYNRTVIDFLNQTVP